MLKRILSCAIAFTYLIIHAHGTTDTTKTDTTEQAAKIEYYGFVDAYYAFNFNAYVDDKVIHYVFNHSRHNEFNVNMALLGMKYQGKMERMAFSVHAGTFGLANYAAEPAIFQHIYEGYAGIKPFGKKNLWLDAGIFSSHIGLETAISKDSWTLTRCLATEYIPYYEAGVRATWEINDKWTVVILGLNGWQNMIDNNNNKALATQVVFKPNEDLLINSSTYFGEGYNAPIGAVQNMRYFHDLYATWSPTKKLGIAGVFDYGLQEIGPVNQYPWWSAALLVKADVTKKLSICARAEYFNDPDEVIVVTPDPWVGFEVGGYSMNIDYKPSKNAMLRLEGKNYMSRGDIFPVPRYGTYLPTSTTITTSLVAWF
jgi:hypothetical protein